MIFAWQFGEAFWLLRLYLENEREVFFLTFAAFCTHTFLTLFAFFFLFYFYLFERLLLLCLLLHFTFYI